MNSKNQGDTEVQGIGWLAGTVGGLLLISLGFELLAHQVFGQTDLDTLLWALYLGFWTCVLGIVGFLILSIRWFADWWRERANGVAMSRNSPPEPRRRHFQKPELGGPQFLQKGMAPVVPSRSSRESDDEDKSNSFNRAELPEQTGVETEQTDRQIFHDARPLHAIGRERER